MNHKPRKCVCGSGDVYVQSLGDCGPEEYAVTCKACDRSGPTACSEDVAIALWDADHEAAAKAREALDLSTVLEGEGPAATALRLTLMIQKALAVLGEDHANE